MRPKISASKRCQLLWALPVLRDTAQMCDALRPPKLLLRLQATFPSLDLYAQGKSWIC